MIAHKHTANSVGGKTARACDNCIRKRARWYCAADDAFLCQSCDASVHSANPLARRHERVRLKTASLRHPNEFLEEKTKERPAPSWHRGFTKKARTPRHGKPVLSTRNPIPLVPEFGGDETSNEENEEQLLYRVPANDPFAAELCSSKEPEIVAPPFDNNEIKGISAAYRTEVERSQQFLPSDMDLAEFAADVESLLGKGLENESFGMEGLGLMGCDKGCDNSPDCSLGSENLVKIEQEGSLAMDVGEDDRVEAEIDISKETFELNFDDYDSLMTCREEEDEKVPKPEANKTVENRDKVAKKKRENFLKLDYESVITAWASRGTLWISGDRPDLDSDDHWPDFLVFSFSLLFICAFLQLMLVNPSLSW